MLGSIVASVENPGDQTMDMLPQSEISSAILNGSVIAYVAAAYFAVGRRLERKTQCSATRGFVLSILSGGTALNQNQIALQLGIDRTVVHRAIKSMAKDDLVSERKEKTGRAIPVQLTAKGKKYHERLVVARKAADEKVRRLMTLDERELLVALLQRITECEF